MINGFGINPQIAQITQIITREICEKGKAASPMVNPQITPTPQILER